MKAMIVAAGLGTRLQPLTHTIPKALVPVAGKPLLEHVIRKLVGAGVTEMVINVHHFPEQIIRFVTENNCFGVTIHFSDESDALLDTGGGIKNARKWLEVGGEPFLVHNVDILSNLDIEALYAQHIHTHALATVVVSERTTSRFLLFDDDMQLAGWINTATGTIKPDDINDSGKLRRLAFSGIHVISPSVFQLMESWPPRFSIIDFYLQQLKKTIKGYMQPDYQMIDVGKPESLAQADAFLVF
jgi:MurNAc alpha-1-phosphate uridylyltransferase